MEKVELNLDSWQRVFSAYVVAASFAGKFLYNEPDKLFLENLSKTVEISNDWPMKSRNTDTDEGIKILNEIFLNISSLNFDEIEEDYNSLFVGPTVLAVPWESVYKTVDKTLFGEPTAEVRKFYAKYNLKAPKLLSEPDDHIGLELLFLSHLCSLGLEKIRNKDYVELWAVVEDIRIFSNSHILSFGFKCLKDVEDNCKTDFFVGVAKLTKGLLQALKEDFIEGSYAY